MNSVARNQEIALNVSRAAGKVITVLLACVITLSLATVVFAQDDGATGAHRIGVLTLVNGNTIAGELRAGDSPQWVGWDGTEFVEPFQFHLGSIKSIKFPVEVAKQAHRGEFAFELKSGDVVTGQLEGWSRDAIEIGSEQFGSMSVRLDSIRRLHRIEENATLVFASLAGLQDWTTTDWDASGWQEDGTHLWTEKLGATLNGDLHVPDRAVVDFEISWTGVPDFVFAIGVDPESDSDSDVDGWRFETVDGHLAIVRTRSATADVDHVVDLTHRQSVRLTAYVDQATGEMQVFLPSGTPAGQIAVKNRDNDESSTPGRGVRLINRGANLRLERLRIAEWLGKTPAPAQSGQVSIALADGSFLSGTIQRLDAESRSLIIGDRGQESSAKVEDVIAIKLSVGETNPEQAQCALFLHGGMRISGNLKAIDDRNWVITGQNFGAPVQVPRDQVRTMIVFKNEPYAGDDTAMSRNGRLELDSGTLVGRLVPAKEQEPARASCLNWHPYGSRNSSRLKPGVSGRIVYRDPPQVDNSTTAARALALQRQRLQQQKRGLNFGELFLRRADNAKSKSTEHDAHVVHIRSGDVIACRVDLIDEQGVHLTTVDANRGFVPHQQIKAIEFVSNSPPPDLNEAKRERLSTIPRLQKSLPPSHLLCSHNGDFLRCRLLRADAESVHVEVQLEVIEIPRGRIAQIIWFHPDESPNGELAPQVAAAQAFYKNLTQVLKNDGKRVTINPTAVTEDSIEGLSDVIGHCRIEMNRIDQLIFGVRIAAEVSDLAYNRWKLRPAVEPLVAQSSGEQPVLGSESPLIGQDAPDVRLESLDGGEIRLSQFKGNIVVLDFWASWCAPCMLTMPLLEEAIAGFDPERVRLLSINLEEPASHIRSVLERHNLNLPVALDIDGVAAQQYQARAIPQLVIIDTAGKVHRLYIGGGMTVVEQMKADITELLQKP